MHSYKYVILGGGTATGYAVKEFVERGVKPGEVALVSSDSTVPYDRPPLSKGFLTGEKSAEDCQIAPRSFYDEHGVDIWLNTPIVQVNLEDRRLITEYDERIGYDSLLIATGGRVRTFGAAGEIDPGIHYLRDLYDARAIRETAKEVRECLVIGGGFIGMEVAASLCTRGNDVRLVFQEDRLNPRVFTPDMSAAFARYFEDKGVTLMPGNNVRKFTRHASMVKAHLENGASAEAPLVVAGVGVQPATRLFEDSRMDTSDGIKVDEYLETEVSHVYAAGDVARWWDGLHNRYRRVEHWQNAANQGRCAAANMMGEVITYSDPPYFFSDVFDLSWELWGDRRPATEAVLLGNLDEYSFSTWWLDASGAVTAAFVMARDDDEREAAKNAVSERAPMPDALRRDAKSLAGV